MKLTALEIILISLVSLLIILLLIILIHKKCSKRSNPSQNVTKNAIKTPIPQDVDRANPLVFRPNTLQTKPYFTWSEDPTILAQIIENGWQRFSFLPPSNSHLGVLENYPNVITSWEIFEESAEYMQKIRLIPQRKSTSNPNPNPNPALFSIRTSLPLPGPKFTNTAFPQEAYFEIKILPNKQIKNQSEENVSRSETKKLIEEDYNANNGLEYLSHSKRNKVKDQVKIEVEEEYEFESVSLAIGLTGGGHLPTEIPGSFEGSVGFNSTGSVYLDGMKLVNESENTAWGREGDIIGCGYNPTRKKVFFTLNSKLANEIHCKSEQFEHPLYPTLAANTDVTVVVNLGQSPFKYEDSNSNRTPNPCFVNPRSSSTVPYYELDSKELFSMGVIDGKWRNWSSNVRSSENVGVECDKMSEGDLFDISVK